MNARRVLRVSLLLLVASASFALVSAWIRPLVPWPEERGLRAKFEYVRAHKDELDSICVGSSRMIRAIDPRVVDAELAARGLPWNTFNFGADGMFGFESDFVLREILALEPARLKAVLFEAATWYPGFDEPGSTNPDSLRCTFWHTPRATRQVLASIQCMDAPLQTKLALVGTHVAACAKKMSNYAQGPRLLGRALGTDRAGIDIDISASLVSEMRGYQPLELLTDKVHTQGREVFLAAADRYAELIGRIPADNAREASLDAYNFAALRDQYRAVEACGAELVQVVMPNRLGSPLFGALERSGHIPVLFHFNRPDSFPELFAVDRHYDAGHLNERGAAEFSRLLARTLADHEQARR